MENNLTPSDRNKVGVYFIMNKATNEFYLGSGKLRDRLRAHKRELVNNRHINYKLQRSFNRNPEMVFVGKAIDVEGLPIEINRSLALGLEQVLIDEHKDDPRLLNIALNVEKPTLGIKKTKEHKEKISKTSAKTWAEMSPERKKLRNERLSESQSALWSSYSEEEKRKRTEVIRHASIGLQLPEERKKKIGDFFRGKQLSSNHREKIGNALRDKPKDPVAVQNAVNARKEKGSYKSNESQKLACSYPVMVDGEMFPSLSACAKAKNTSHQTVSNRIRNSNFPGWTKADNPT